MPSFCINAGAPSPTFQPSGRSPLTMRSRRVASCFSMPRAMRASSQGFATSDSVDQDHCAFRHRVAIRDQWPIAGIVVPGLRGFLAWEFDNHDARRLVALEHLVRTALGQVTATVFLDEWNRLGEI